MYESLTDCGYPPDVDHGVVSVLETTYNTTGTVSCALGYNLVGTQEITCLANGKWSSDDFSCAIVGTVYFDRDLSFLVVR